MHRVKRAIILAAGIGKRLRPITLHTPKPLIRVNGMPMIETAITALRANGVFEIYVVVGYKRELFEWLPETYSGLKLIYNPYYAETNNISSLYVARNMLSDCLIMDGDQVVCDFTVLDPTFERSGYNVTWCDGVTNEWLLQTDDGIVRSCSRGGGACGWQLHSISRWTAEDGDRLAKHVAIEFERGNTDIYWDDIPLFCYPDEYKLGVRIMDRQAVIEIDTAAELAMWDNDNGVIQLFLV